MNAVSTSISKYLQVYQSIYKCIKVSTSISKYLQVYHSIYKYIKVSTSISKYLQVYQSIYKYIKASTSISKYLQVYHSIYKYITVSTSISKYLQVYHSYQTSKSLCLGKTSPQLKRNRGMKILSSQKLQFQTIGVPGLCANHTMRNQGCGEHITRTTSFLSCGNGLYKPLVCHFFHLIIQMFPL